MFLEECDGPLPGQSGRIFRKAGRRIPVEPEARSRIGVRLQIDANGRQGRFVLVPHGIDPLILLCVVDQWRGLYSGNILRFRRRTEEGRKRLDVGAQRRGQRVGRTTST